MALQHALDLLQRELANASQKRTNIQAIMNDIMWAIQKHDSAISGADRQLLDDLMRAVNGTHPVPQEPFPPPQYARANGHDPRDPRVPMDYGQFGPYGNG